MSNQIDQYLTKLRREMAGCDPATIQDATADAHEHLAMALENAQTDTPELDEAEALAAIIADYGSPEEIAAAYRQAESVIRPYAEQGKKGNSRGPLARFFGIYGDSAAWGSVLYMLISFLTGALYFIWITYGLSLSLVFSLFIFGMPFAVLFFLSMRGLGVLEGRMVEGLLGVRMPRRPIFFPRDLKWRDRLVLYLKDKQTWRILLYLFLQMPIGVIYVTIWAVVFGLGLAFLAGPFIQEMFGLPIITLGDTLIYAPIWMLPFFSLLGIIIITAFMHAAKGIGKLHGRYAKSLLVAN